MDNDVSSSPTKSNRQGRQRRRIFGGAGAVLLVLVGVVVGGTLQHSKTGTSGALGANVCPVVNPTTHLPSIVPVAEVNWANCNLSTAKLVGAYLWGANLNGANLNGANLTGATLTGANVGGATWALTICPDGWLTMTPCVGHGGGL